MPPLHAHDGASFIARKQHNARLIKESAARRCYSRKRADFRYFRHDALLMAAMIMAYLAAMLKGDDALIRQVSPSCPHDIYISTITYTFHYERHAFDAIPAPVPLQLASRDAA